MFSTETTNNTHSTAAKAFVLGQLSALVLQDEELTFLCARPEEFCFDIGSDSVPKRRFRITLQEVTA